MKNYKTFDLSALDESVNKEVDANVLSDKQINAYKEEYLTPFNVGYRKGIFVPRELVHKLAKTVALFGYPDLTIGAYVTNILISHLVANRNVINELAERGTQSVMV